ncbi:small ribosomal subunit protein mS37-like [Glandiceps talaboti]
MPSPNSMLWRARMAVPANIHRPKVAVSKKPILKDEVSNKSDNKGSATCIQEMSVLMSCWRLHDYNDTKCDKEITAFQKCAAAAEKARQVRTAGNIMGKPETGKLPSKQVNVLLKRYPQPAVITDTT